MELQYQSYGVTHNWMGTVTGVKLIITIRGKEFPWHRNQNPPPNRGMSGSLLCALPRPPIMMGTTNLDRTRIAQQRLPLSTAVYAPANGDSAYSIVCEKRKRGAVNIAISS